SRSRGRDTSGCRLTHHVVGISHWKHSKRGGVLGIEAMRHSHIHALVRRDVVLDPIAGIPDRIEQAEWPAMLAIRIDGLECRRSVTFLREARNVCPCCIESVAPGINATVDASYCKLPFESGGQAHPATGCPRIACAEGTASRMRFLCRSKPGVRLRC